LVIGFPADLYRTGAALSRLTQNATGAALSRRAQNGMKRQ